MLQRLIQTNGLEQIIERRPGLKGCMQSQRQLGIPGIDAVPERCEVISADQEPFRIREIG